MKIYCLSLFLFLFFCKLNGFGHCTCGQKKKKQSNNVTEYVENCDRRFNTFSDILLSKIYGFVENQIFYFYRVKRLVWCTWRQDKRHHECGDGCTDCGEPAARPRCRPPEPTSHSRRPRLFARPHPFFGPSQPTGCLLCTIGKQHPIICILLICSHLRLFN